MITYPVGLLTPKGKADPFKLTIDTSLGSGNTFTLPLPSGQSYDFWWNAGDGSQDKHVTAYNDANITHTYSSAFSGQVQIGTRAGDKCGGWSFNDGGDKLKVTSIDNYGQVDLDYTNGFFFGCSNITGTFPPLPDYFTKIASDAFNGCSGFTGSLAISTGVTNIDGNAFLGCSGFDGTLTLPNGLTTIGNFAFQDCSGFTGALVLPNTVTSLGQAAFRSCSGFTGSLTISTGITVINANTFRSCSGFTGSLLLPSGLTVIGAAAFLGCSGFTGSLSFPSGLTTISSSVFFGCSGFTGSLSFPSGLTTISDSVFANCSGFNATLTFHTGITTIGVSAFTNCINIIRVDSFPLTAPFVDTNGLVFNGTPRPLHIQSSGTSGYGVSPWTDTGIFSTIIQDL